MTKATYGQRAIRNTALGFLCLGPLGAAAGAALTKRPAAPKPAPIAAPSKPAPRTRIITVIVAAVIVAGLAFAVAQL